jgi:hypothetical protein
MIVMDVHGLATVVPDRWRGAGYQWEMVPAEGRVLEGKWVEELRTGRGGLKHRRTSPRSLVGYSAGEDWHEVWVRVPDSMQHDSSLTQRGSKVTVWYHPDRPESPTLIPPSRWGDAVGVLLSGLLSTFLVGTGTVVVILGLVRLFRPAAVSNAEPGAAPDPARM